MQIVKIFFDLISISHGIKKKCLQNFPLLAFFSICYPENLFFGH